MRAIAQNERLIVALDVDTPDAARALVRTLGSHVTFYKIGLELAYGGGFPLVSELVDAGKKVFLDLKLHDIPNTVERAAIQVARLGAHLLTVHAYPQTMRAAIAGTAGTDLRLLGVTVMTSYDDADLAEAGYGAGVAATVARRAAQAATCKLDGLILSAAELAVVRAQIGSDLLLVTPGIRPAGAALADQKRVMTPTEAIHAGADHLVVGRPIIAVADPAAAAAAIQAEIATALA
jgi:orotidine-5'-phosphate decarboxylase